MAMTAMGAILLARGAADPPVAARVMWRDSGAASWIAGTSQALAPGDGLWMQAPDAARLPDGALTVEVAARLTPESDPGAAWGVWVEESDGARLFRVIYAVSGEGYITTRRCPDDALPAAEIEQCPAVRPEWRWMRYPRANLVGQTNEITLHQEPSGAMRFRLNDEQLGAAPVARTGRWGVWARGGRESDAILWWAVAAVRCSACP